MATKTRKDYEEEAILRNWATAQPGTYYATGNGMQQYTGWNGGSVTGADMMAASSDANKYDYDIMLDPRNNGGARDAIGNLLLDVSEKANTDAVSGIGDYDTNRQNYLNKIGWTDYQQVFKNLQDTGSLGLTTLDGRSLEEAAGLGNPNWMSNEQWAAYEKEMAPIWAEQQAQAEAMAAQQAYVQSHLSPLMNGQTGGERGGAWGYNEEDDPVWDAILKQYTRAGEKGMNDALAQLSARTGGMASSYAGQVAQQTMNDYMQGATDYIPQLYEAAYGRYMDEQNMNIAAEERAYQRQQDALDRQIAAEQTAWERQAYQNELAYNREQDALDRQFAQDQFDWEQQKYWANLNKSASGGGNEYDFDWAYEILMSGIDSPVARDIFKNTTGAEWSDSYLAQIEDEYEPRLDFDEVQEQIDMGNYTSGVLKDYAYYNDQEFEIPPDNPLIGNELHSTMNRLNAYLSSGVDSQIAMAEEITNNIWPRLTSKQKQAVRDMMVKYGYIFNG